MSKFLLKKSAVLCIALVGTVLTFSDEAFAKSAGCTQWTFSGNSNGVSGSNLAFEVNETASVSLTENNGTADTYTFIYTDIANGNQTITRNGTINIGGTVNETITIPRNTTSGRLNLVINSGGMTAVTLSCDEASDPTPETPQSSKPTTSSAVVSSVSRSQTTVLLQNIGARLSAVSTPADYATSGWTSGQGNGTTGRGFGNNNDNATNANLFDDPAYYHRANSTTGYEGLRHIAMMASFDSSTGEGMHMLGLGPREQGNAGGASGIGGRSSFVSALPFTIWGHGSYTSFDNDYVSGANDNRYDGDVWGYNVGLDYRLAENMTAGLSLGYNDTDLNTLFNDGSYQEKGWVVSPYAIYTPVSGLVISAQAGFGIGKIDITRDNNEVSGKTESDIWYASVNMSYRVIPIKSLSAVSFTPSLGFIAARKTVDGYTESDNTVVSGTTANTRQIRPAIEAAYDFTPTQNLTISPFLETSLIYDFTDAINNDKTAFTIGGGVRLSDRLTGLNAALEGSYLAGQTDYTQYTIGGTVTYGFDLKGADGRSVGTLTPFFNSNLNEYGNQRLRTGFGFDNGWLISQLALSHMMSVANDNDDNSSSAIELSLSMPF
ncbi:autotransporter outer membrane beta-barrel domain-containing protein [Methylophaga muralis]|uniref:Autotransporter beta-domain protein n=1 Tax=Methylophaga muralis TaxID=291169 RepID=A0A1E3GNI1_9GAMM|nr:autotransporter outer membrane beta-barrel domain-containing protein [Methylophaga muralis]ODN65567.1 Autotransporter beta-domain protein [Methylophaga muralis]